MNKEFVIANEIKGAIFDLDGTLTDSMSKWSEIYGVLADFLQVNLPDDLTVKLNCIPMQKRVEKLAEELLLNIDTAELYEIWLKRAREFYGNVFKIKPYMLETVKLLHSLNISMAIASATDPACIIDFINSNELSHYFKCITGLDEVQRSKNFPDIYLKTADKLKVRPSECLVFEDTLVTVKSAKKGGFIVCGVQDDCSAADMLEIKEISDLTLGFDRVGNI